MKFRPALRAVVAGSLVAALALGMAALNGAPVGAQTKGRVVAVEAVTLKRAPLVESVSAVGNLIADESVIIRPEIDGRIVEIAFEEGRPVKPGQLLFRLDAAVYQAELQEAQARLALARRNYERVRALNIKGHSSGEILDKALSEMQIAEASVALNKARLEKMRLVAPFAGIVGLRQVSLGAFVEAKTELVALVSLESMKVEFRLPERYFRVIAEGGVVRAAPDALPGEVFEGRIYAIAPAIDINGRSVAVKARLLNAGNRLRPGMFARVSLLIDRAKDALVVPESTIIQRGDGQFVYRVVDGRAVLTAVQLGLRQTGRIEVVAGLSEGDSVITAGQIKLRAGDQVKVVDYSAPDARTQ